MGGLFASTLVLTGRPQLAASTLVGAALMLFNVIALGWTVDRMLAKKSIAWTVLIIVIKYAVLLGSIYILAQTAWFSSIGAGIGLVSFVLAILVFAMLSHWKELGKLGSL